MSVSTVYSAGNCFKQVNDFFLGIFIFIRRLNNGQRSHFYIQRLILNKFILNSLGFVFRLLFYLGLGVCFYLNANNSN